MKKNIRFLTISAIVLVILPVFGATGGTARLVVDFFGSSTCEECEEIRTALLVPLQDRYRETLDVVVHDVDSDSGLAQALAMEKQYKVLKTSSQELFLPDTFLTGYDDIMKKGKFFIESRLLRRDSLKTPVLPVVKGPSAK